MDSHLRYRIPRVTFSQDITVLPRPIFDRQFALAILITKHKSFPSDLIDIVCVTIIYVRAKRHWSITLHGL